MQHFTESNSNISVTDDQSQLQPPIISDEILPQAQCPSVESSSGIPPHVPPPNLFDDIQVGEHRIFLDVCCGINRPLSQATQKFKCDVLSFDILLNDACDILDDSAFEQLLKLCFSGAVGYASFSPSCSEYSRLKLKEGGPPALRSPEYLDGLPNLSAQNLQKVQESHIMFSRCVTGARAVFQEVIAISSNLPVP